MAAVSTPLFHVRSLAIPPSPHNCFQMSRVLCYQNNERPAFAALNSAANQDEALFRRQRFCPV